MHVVFSLRNGGTVTYIHIFYLYNLKTNENSTYKDEKGVEWMKLIGLKVREDFSFHTFFNCWIFDTCKLIT